MPAPNIPPQRIPWLHPNRTPVRDDHTGKAKFTTVAWNEAVELDHLEFPKMMYHRVQDERIVSSQAEQDALGEEWATTPFRVKRASLMHPAVQKTADEAGAAAKALAVDPDYKEFLQWKAFQGGKAAASAPAPAPAPAEAHTSAFDRRESLIKVAEQKGIKVDGRWSLDRLEEELSKAAA